MYITQLFEFANLFVLPFWLLIIFLPRWGVTKRIMASPLPFIVLAGLYIYCLVGTIDSESAQALANPKLADIARFFGEEGAAATGWIHFLVMDLFVGRWIYWQGEESGIWTTHSLVFCLFFGPVGLLSHLLTASIYNRFFAPAEEETSTTEAPST